MNKTTLSEQIRNYASELGFDACGFCKSEFVGEEATNYFKEWIDNSRQGEMNFMSNYTDKRLDTSLLVEGSKSVISLAINYYPAIKQDDSKPQFAYYAYGQDYHEVVKQKLTQLLEYIQQLVPNTVGRVFCDTAPILERYWAAKSGIGFIGKNSLLIIPKMGSFFFLGEIILDLDMEYGTPLTLSCGRCTRCMTACPTQAIIAPKVIDANKCLSYQTIENRDEIPDSIKPKMTNRFYGCDICQLVCPWNKYAKPHRTPEFNPSEAFLDLDSERLTNLTVEEYQTTFKGSAIKRAKYSGLKRNIIALKEGRKILRDSNNTF